MAIVLRFLKLKIKEKTGRNPGKKLFRSQDSGWNGLSKKKRDKLGLKTSQEEGIIACSSPRQACICAPWHRDGKTVCTSFCRFYEEKGWRETFLLNSRNGRACSY